MADPTSKGGSLPLASAPAYDTSSRTPNRDEAIHAGSSATPSPKGFHPLKPPEVSAAANALVQLAMAERKGVLQTPDFKKTPTAPPS